MVNDVNPLCVTVPVASLETSSQASPALEFRHRKLSTARIGRQYSAISPARWLLAGQPKRSKRLKFRFGGIDPRENGGRQVCKTVQRICTAIGEMTQPAK